MSTETDHAHLSPRFSGEVQSAEGRRALNATLQSVGNVVERRGYCCFIRENVLYTIDVFDPCELRLEYNGDQETVLALLFRSTDTSVNFHYHDPPASFFALLDRLHGILQPRRLCVTYSLAVVAKALLERRLLRNPWDLIYPLTLLGRETVNDLNSAANMPHKVVPLANGDVLVQVCEGINPVLSASYSDLEAIVNRRSFTAYVDGTDSVDLAVAAGGGVWPTPVRSDGSTETNVGLVASQDEDWRRQGLFQMEVADRLQQEGEEIRGFQVPVVSGSTAIVIPLVLVRHSEPDVCVYTQSEPWSAARSDAFGRWLKDLRRLSDSHVTVVSRHVWPHDVANVKGVSFVHYPESS